MGVGRGIHGWIAALVAVWLAMAAWMHVRYLDEPAATHYSHRYWNGEAGRHFLNVLGRYSRQPIEAHWFAPTAPCTLPPSLPCTETPAANVPGSAVVTSARLGGKVVYTSFPPGGMLVAAPFVLPLANGLQLDPLRVLRCFNLLLALLTTLFVAASLDRLVATALRYRGALIAMGCLPLLLSVEVMHSHYVSMWSHQVLQPFLAAMLFVSLGPMNARRAAVLGVLAAVACWIEWAAFLACIALFVVVALRSRPGMRVRNVLLFSAIALCGGVSLLLYYAWLVGIDAYLPALTERMAARSLLDPGLRAAAWLRSLMQSWLPWQLVSAVLLLLYLPVQRAGEPRAPRDAPAVPMQQQAGRQRWLAAAAVVTLPLLENVLLSQHAIIYTFDRLKWAPFFAVLIAFLGQGIIGRHGARGAWLLAVLTTLAAAASVVHLTWLYPRYW